MDSFILQRQKNLLDLPDKCFNILFAICCQAVVQNPFNSSSPTPDNQPDTRFTYFPTVSVGAGDVDTSHTEVTNALAGQAGRFFSETDIRWVLVIIWGYFLYFCIKTYIVGTH